MKKALIIGATGATGSELTKQLLDDNFFDQIHVFVRTPPEINHPKLVVHKVDFDNIEAWKENLTGNVLFSAMGSTLKSAGSKKAQYKIDVTYQFEVAKAAAENKVDQLILVSSVGANQNSIAFYPKIKGLIEEKVKQLKFKCIYILRPPFLDRGNEKMRDVERISISILNKLNKIGLMRSQKPMSTSFLASKMIFLAQKKCNKKSTTLEAKALFELR